MNIWVVGKIQWNFITYKIIFYFLLNRKNITDADNNHSERVCKDFKINNLRENQDFYIQNNALLLADAFENFQSMASSLNKYQSKIRSVTVTDINLFLLV